MVTGVLISLWLSSAGSGGSFHMNLVYREQGGPQAGPLGSPPNSPQVTSLLAHAEGTLALSNL